MQQCVLWSEVGTHPLRYLWISRQICKMSVLIHKLKSKSLAEYHRLQLGAALRYAGKSSLHVFHWWTDKRTDRQSARQAGSQTNRQADNLLNRSAFGRTNRQPAKQVGSQINRQTTCQTGRQSDIQTGRQTARQVGSQTNRQADRHPDRLVVKQTER
jgi:hypothetical protein